MKFTRPVSEGGLANQVQAFAQDGKGFIWMATQNGITRYDGIRYTGYENDPKDPKSFPAAWVGDLAVDTTGKLWAAGDTGLLHYDPIDDSFQAIPRLSVGYQAASEGEEAASLDIVATAIHVDASGTLWAALSDFGLASVNTKTLDVTLYREALLEFVVKDILDDGKGTLWLGTVEGGVIAFDPAKKEVTAQFWNEEGEDDQLVEDEIKSMAWDEVGASLWVGTVSTGLDLLNLKTGKATHYTHDVADPGSISLNKIYFVFVDSEKTLWVGTNAGLNHFDKATGKFSRYIHETGDATSISFNIVLAGFEDDAGVLWFGTIGSGISTVDRLAMNLQYHQLGMSLGFAEDTDNNLWVGTAGSGLYKYDYARAERVNYTSFGVPGDQNYFELKGSKLAAMRFDNEGLLWILAYPNGMLAFNPETEEHQVFDSITSDSISSDFLMDFVEDKKGNYWIASHGEGAGLMYFDKSDQSFDAVTTETSLLPSDNLYTVRFDRANPNLLWIGTGDAGLASYNIATEEAKSFTFDQEFANQAVEYIHQDSEGILWFGTENGLGRFDPTKPDAVELIELGDGINAETVYAILEDTEQRLWMTTDNSGLIVYDKNTKKSQNYLAADGAQDNEYAQQAFYQSPSGKMAFGGFKGFNFFYPKTIVPDAHKPTVVLTDFLLFEESQHLKDAVWNQPKIKLSHTENDIEIQFAALSYAAPNLNRYRYKMVGVDKDWKVKDATRAFASYPNMEFGDYEFKVQAKGRHGDWNEEQTATLSIHVDRPPWRTWWAYLLYAAAVGILIFFYLRFQKEKLTSLANQANLEKVERDLELTGAVQTGFLPTDPTFRSEAFELHGVYHPAESTSGDWWWHTFHDGWHFTLVGDVTGHGPGPAMVTAAVATAFRVQPTEKEIVSRFETINEEVLRVGRGKYMMALSVLAIEEATGNYVYYSMGGLPALHCSSNKVASVATRGTLLGNADFSVGVKEGTLQAGDRVMLYTDGIPEIEMANGRQVGMRRFTGEYQRSSEMPLSQAAREMVEFALRVDSAEMQDDDWTFAMIKWDGIGAAPSQSGR
tara:strand:+ start:107610 stop:110780 length:3171 start_codon:yes stop_codon:yes gene_type:complete